MHRKSRRLYKECLNATPAARKIIPVYYTGYCVTQSEQWHSTFVVNSVRPSHFITRVCYYLIFLSTTRHRQFITLSAKLLRNTWHIQSWFQCCSLAIAGRVSAAELTDQLNFFGTEFCPTLHFYGTVLIRNFFQDYRDMQPPSFNRTV